MTNPRLGSLRRIGKNCVTQLSELDMSQIPDVFKSSAEVLFADGKLTEQAVQTFGIPWPPVSDTQSKGKAKAQSSTGALELSEEEDEPLISIPKPASASKRRGTNEDQGSPNKRTASDPHLRVVSDPTGAATLRTHTTGSNLRPAHGGATTKQHNAPASGAHIRPATGTRVLDASNNPFVTPTTPASSSSKLSGPAPSVANASNNPFATPITTAPAGIGGAANAGAAHASLAAQKQAIITCFMKFIDEFVDLLFGTIDAKVDVADAGHLA